MIELGVVELLARRARRVGLFRPIGHASADTVVSLLRTRYRLEPPLSLLCGFSYEQAAVIRAERGTDELVRMLVDRIRALRRRCDAVLVLGTDFSGTAIPDELEFNARLANESGALVLPVVGGSARSLDTVAAEVFNAGRAYTDLGCTIPAIIANRVAPKDTQALAHRLARHEFAGIYAGLRAHKGVTVDQARDIIYDPCYFGILMVHQGLADGVVGGVARSTAATLRPAFEIVKTAPGVTLASSAFLMCLADRVLVYADCAVNPNPTRSSRPT